VLLLSGSWMLLSALVSPDTIGRLAAVFFAIDVASGAAAGYLAARVGRMPLAAAFVLGVLGVALAMMSPGDGNDWYRTGLQLSLIPAAVSGGWLRARHLASDAA